jgi:hypothetical protein
MVHGRLPQPVVPPHAVDNERRARHHEEKAKRGKQGLVGKEIEDLKHAFVSWLTAKA